MGYCIGCTEARGESKPGMGAKRVDGSNQLVQQFANHKLFVNTRGYTVWSLLPPATNKPPPYTYLPLIRVRMQRCSPTVSVTTIEEGIESDRWCHICANGHSWSDCTGGGSRQYNHIPVLKCGCTGKTKAARAVWSAVSIGADMTSPVALYLPLCVKL